MMFGQDVVSHMVGCFVPVEGNGYDELGVDDLFLVFRVGGGAQGIEVIDEECLQFAFFDQVGHDLGDAPARLHGGILTVDAGAVDARPFFRLEAFGLGQGAELDACRRQKTAVLIKVADEGVDDDIGLSNLGAGHIMVVQAVVAGIEEGRRSVLGQVTGDLPDLAGGDAANLGCLLGCEMAVGRPELFEAVAVLAHEGTVINTFAHEGMGQAEIEGQVSAGPDGNPFIGDFGQLAQAGIDDNDFCAPLLGFCQLVHGGRHNGSAIVAATEEHIARAREVGHGLGAHHAIPGIGFGVEAGGIMGDVIGRTDFVQQV